MKARKLHRVPLSKRSIDILAAGNTLRSSHYILSGHDKKQAAFKHELLDGLETHAG
jgi:hypothetical protein